MKYRITFDNGKPYEMIVNSEEELEKAIREFYLENKDRDFGYYFSVYDDKGKDISESQFIQEMLSDIIGGEE